MCIKLLRLHCKCLTVLFVSYSSIALLTIVLKMLEFPTSRLEMSAVADIFDRDGDGYIDYYEFVAALHPNKDAYKPITDADKIEDEVLITFPPGRTSTVCSAQIPCTIHAVVLFPCLVVAYRF